MAVKIGAVTTEVPAAPADLEAVKYTVTGVFFVTGAEPTIISGT